MDFHAFLLRRTPLQLSHPNRIFSPTVPSNGPICLNPLEFVMTIPKIALLALLIGFCSAELVAQEVAQETAPPLAAVAVADDAAADADGFAPDGYVMAWRDDFDSEDLNVNDWFYRDGIDRNLTIMARENVILEHGELNLVCQVGDFAVVEGQYGHQGDPARYSFKGAGVISDWRFSEGYYEARSYMLGADHWHPAFWLEQANANLAPGAENSLLRWNSKAEIDIMECEPQWPVAQSIRIHDWVTGGEHRRLPPPPGMTPSSDQSEDWFIWGMQLTRDQAIFYENGVHVITVDIPEDFVRDPRNLILSCLTIKNPTQSGIQKFDWVRYYEPQTLRDHPRKECELLIQQTSLVGMDFGDRRDANASNGYLQIAQNVQPGDDIQYRIYVNESGDYDITLGGGRGEGCGQWQLQIDGDDHGPVIDQAGPETYDTWNLGTRHFPTAGYYVFRFVAQGEGDGAFDYIELTPRG